jgi:putative transposase
MARIPRYLILDNEHQAHKIWRGHNKDWNISTPEEKSTYMSYLNKLLEKNKNELNAFGLMSNHTHELFDIVDRSEFSKLMRDHHSRYGMFFNKKHRRCGPVAYDRPKTCMIENDEYSMRATFYIHANPLRAGISKNAANYKWSTHRLYAFGEKDELTKKVKFPGWYMALGSTWESRQRIYRQLFDIYLKEEGLIKQDFLYNHFFGSMLWLNARNETVKNWRIDCVQQSPP